ncbi:hypothetical protein D1AOALGA4SA_13172 [Olavius algarvensis Delta 1 endosymbiont]|nr:hypothetical protein D1AOALGA4SA_13172 [Olavius algarvensis Delta 1 endosymbiont]
MLFLIGGSNIHELKRFQVSGVRCQVSGVRILISGVSKVNFEYFEIKLE